MTIDRNVKNEFQKWAESSVGKDCHYEDWHSGARIRVFPQIKGIEYQLWRCYGEYVGLAINLQNVEDRKAIRTAIDNEKLIYPDWEWHNDCTLKCKKALEPPKEMLSRLICLHALIFKTTH